MQVFATVCLLLMTACASSPGMVDSVEPGHRTTPAQLAFATSDMTDVEVMPEPGPRDWLTTNPQEQESFAEYVASEPVRATARRGVIAVLPVGPFTPDEWQAAETGIALTGLWFDLPVRVLPPAELPATGHRRERTFGFGGPTTQFHTAWFRNELLPAAKPDDAVCVIAVTMSDLYPRDSWAFVFGQARFRDGVGVYSLARLFQSFYTGNADPAESLAAARGRAAAVMVHELGHMFDIPHCVEHLCLMNGANTLAESDRQPWRLCPPCLRKLQWNRRFDVLDRYDALAAFYRKRGFTDELAWVQRRVRRIEGAQ